MSTGSARGVGFWIRRYLPSEIAGTATALLAAAIAYRLSGSLFLAAIACTIGENLGFYLVVVVRNLTEQWRHPSGDRTGRRRAELARTAWLLVGEFGPAELVDTLLVRPLLLWLAPVLIGFPVAGWIVGKVGADLVFYTVAGFGYVLGRYWDAARRPPGASVADDALPGAGVRTDRIDELRHSLAGIDLDALVMTNGSPLLLLDLGRVAEQYERLRCALPFVRWHYAVKALSHPGVIQTIASLGGSFDVANDCEIDMVLRHNVAADRIIHTHPVKTATEITRAYVLGVRTFVVDSAGELAKFRNVPANVSLLIRLAYPDPGTKSHLSGKFGVSALEAEVLLSQAITQGSHIAGFSFHVGNQVDSVAAFAAATANTLELMDLLEHRWDARFTMLDIGGGFPVGNRTEVASIEQIAAALRPLLEPHSTGLRILAEPGRILVADAATLVSRVIGVREQGSEAWCFIDDGVYGSYSNVITKGDHAVLMARSELDGEETPLRPTSVGGPTCDSADVVARCYPLPRLREGDLLLSPAMGAYTAVTATTFNGRRPARVIVRDPVTVRCDDDQARRTSSR